MNNFAPHIDSDAVSNLPLRAFEGEILVVDSEHSMRAAEDILRGQHLLGFDTETRPAFRKGQYYDLALMQISTDSIALLFRLQLQPLSAAIVDMLQDESVKKIGAAIRDDIKAVQKMAPFKAAGFVDLQNIVGAWGIEEKSVRKMAAIVLGCKVSKAQRLSNWEAVKLLPAQQQYAATDAWVCREIFLKLTQNGA